MFDLSKENPVFAKSGDKIKFESVSKDQYLEIRNEVDSKNYVLAYECILF